MKFNNLIILFILLCSIASADETLDVAWTIYQEARGESYEGKLAVASVIYNRSFDRHLTLSQVCTQRLQFSCWNSRRTPKRVNSIGWKQCEQIAKSMTDKVFRPLNNWNHYYNPSLCNPSWGSKMKNVTVIGNHKFGRI
jgi:N-acetylmuramoyl-L-alanine amidase